MDWLKLFTLLVAVASITIKADGPKKKIRIHLPQKVKHIHHHKKIYITNHPASSQYAPAYLPSAEATVAVPTNVALPAMANLVPINSMDIYDEPQQRIPNIAPAASHILPLYHARGYYGPTPAEIEEPDYDVAPASEPSEYITSGFSSPAVNRPSHPPKRVKIIKLNESPRKKVIRKVKPKRVVFRNKPRPTQSVDDEHPVSTFHEQFYSDVDGSGTIRKIRKPPRVEKIVDGDTEHIHTYSEEHIHKVIFDDGPKLASVVGVDPLTGMAPISSSQQIIPYKNTQALVAIPSNPFGSLTHVGSMGNPHFEYAAYNPREVTHDHIFHDHGEIPADIDMNKETLGLPPKVSYNSNGLRISSSQQKRPKVKHSQKNKKITKPLPTDFSYYESIYASNNRPNKVQRPTISVPSYDSSDETNIEEFRPIPDFSYKETNKKPRNLVPTYYGQTNNDYRIQQANAPSPFSVSSTVVHDYTKPKKYSASSSSSVSKFKDPFVNFKDSYANNFEYDTYASSSNIYTSEDKNDAGYDTDGKTDKKKSISTQNISFGGQDHIAYVDHLQDASILEDLDSNGPTALDNMDQFDQTPDGNSVTPVTFNIKESSPNHQYYSVIATKPLHGEQSSHSDASNDNYQHADIPTPATTPFASVATIAPPSSNYNIQSTEAPQSEIKLTSDTRQISRNREKYQYSNHGNIMVEHFPTQNKDYRTRALQNQGQFSRDQSSATTVRGKLKYGDKI